jgi:small basic protein
VNLRLVIFIAAALEAAIWLAAVIWAGQQPRKPDISVFHGLFFFFVVPAVALALWGRWLRVAAWLTGIVAFMLFAVAVGSQMAR